MSKREIDWSIPQRQSPSALIILLYKALIDLVKFLWPLLLLMIFRGKSKGVDTYEIIALVISILSLSKSALEYLNFRISVVNNELIINKGFITRKTITLPLERIQAVHVEQTWLHNLFNVSQLSFDSAGSEKMEVKIEALDKERSSDLRELIVGLRGPSLISEQPVAQVEEETLITLNGTDLFKLSLSANHLEAFFILIAFLYSTFQTVGISDQEYTGVMKWLSEMFTADTTRLLLLLGVVVMIVSIGISVVKILLTYFEFIITRSVKGFRIKSGLINKNEKFVPFKRIQYVSWQSNWVRQQIGLFLLQFHATGADDFQNKMKVKVPVTRRASIPVLLSDYHPVLSIAEIVPIRVHIAYIWRRVLLWALIPLLLASPFLFIYFNERSFLGLILILLVLLYSWLFYHKFRLWMADEALQIKRGVFGRQELVLKWNKIQSVHLSQSIYQKRKNLATIELRTAAGPVRIPYIVLDEARGIMNYALYKIESSKEKWS